ncbi:hypothetical protein [Streptomyces sp. SAJ15]|uniref:hypothetical protein n=1 Tax=Streptomyces sp. SAJ15 TaxID=2011095 RepID=UPI001184ED5D|nr:hypothetical protein [Streptomyces sp. SAJ15]TVL93947.1 hypothetical protein CD790_02710 [Streptomyces sp. SAJ15]
MSLKDDLTAAQRCLDDLGRAVDRLERQVGGSTDIRRLRSDTDHLREDLDLLRAAVPGAGTPSGSAPGAAGRSAPPSTAKGPDMVQVPDTPYDPTMWRDSDDEGLGLHDRHAP